MHKALLATREKVDRRTQAASAKAQLEREHSLAGDTRSVTKAALHHVSVFSHLPVHFIFSIYILCLNLHLINAINLQVAIGDDEGKNTK